jgi:hypothetical protein
LRRVGPPALSSVAAWCFSLNLHWRHSGRLGEKNTVCLPARLGEDEFVACFATYCGAYIEGVERIIRSKD